MLKREEFRNDSKGVIDFIERYFKSIESLPVKSQVQPGEIYNLIPDRIPIQGNSLDHLINETWENILPGITHWQHPNFHAYFPANSSMESLYAEMITSAIAAQCMIWDTSPAAAELEERMMEWMRDAMNLPHSWKGVIQDTASTATLCALICAREKVTNFESNNHGVPGNLRVYCSSQTHSSIEKGVGIAGIGRKNLIEIGSKNDLTLDAALLKVQIKNDIQNGFAPCCVIVSIGTTGTVEVDDLGKITKVCKAYDVWLHVDAAFAGTALFLPEYQYLIDGIDQADSFVFNPHKWLFTNFDCTAYYVKDESILIQTFEILPEYLKTKTSREVNNYRDWGIPLGRRFRALKLWYVLSSYGLEGIQKRLREQIQLNQYFCDEIRKLEYVEIIKDAFLTFTAFRITSNQLSTLHELNQLNESLLLEINQSGEAYLTHTKFKGQYVIRVVTSQTYIEQRHVDQLIELIKEKSTALLLK